MARNCPELNLHLNSLLLQTLCTDTTENIYLVDVFRVPLLRNGLHNAVVLLLLGAGDIEYTASSIVA
jgi:hypothetical protein